jgi:hypothetical protein
VNYKILSLIRIYEYRKEIFEDKTIGAPMYIGIEKYLFYHMKTNSHRKFYI